MKKLKNLNLRQLGQAELSKKEMNALTGGQGGYGYGGYELPEVYVCGCGCNCSSASCPCKYAGEQEGPDDAYYGGSSTSDNYSANKDRARNNASTSSSSAPSV